MNNPSTSRTYQDPEDLFLIQLPADWLVDSSGEFGTRAAFVSPKVEGGFQANVNVVVNHIPPLTRDEFLTLSRLQLKMASGLAQLPVDEPADDRGAAHCFEWMNNQSPVPLKIRQKLFFTEKKAFILTATALASNFENHRQTFDSMFDSFEVK